MSQWPAAINGLATEALQGDSPGNFFLAHFVFKK